MRVFGRQQFVRLIRYNVLILLCRSCLTRVHLCLSHNNIIHTDSRRAYCYSKRNGRCSFAAARSEKTLRFSDIIIYYDKRPREDSTRSCFSHLVSRLSGARTFLSISHSIGSKSHPLRRVHSTSPSRLTIR